jgi:hypothetical protein
MMWSEGGFRSDRIAAAVYTLTVSLRLLCALNTPALKAFAPG